MRDAPQLEAFNRIARLIFCAKALAGISLAEIDSRLSELRQAYSRIRHLSGRGFVVFPAYGTTDLVSEYMRILTLREVIDSEIFVRSLIQHRESLQALYRQIGFLDAMAAIASYRESLACSANAVLEKATDSQPMILEFTDLYHPLLEDPIRCTLKIDKPMLITGSNASGKSTFLKTVAVNAILAQTIATVHARSYHASYFKVLTSMALRDNMYRGESYFIVEAKSMKRMIDQTGNDIPCICVIDEILRGTNTPERIAAASELFRYLCSRRALCLAATHDYELIFLLEGICTNWHFAEEIVDKSVVFDYQIRPGYKISFNALKILEALHYPAELIRRAERTMSEFSKKENLTIKNGLS